MKKNDYFLYTAKMCLTGNLLAAILSARFSVARRQRALANSLYDVGLIGPHIGERRGTLYIICSRIH